MTSPLPVDFTRLLVAWSEGDETSLDALVPVVYRELRQLARQYMRKERAGHTLQATGLVHEAYRRLVDTPRIPWKNRAHFFAVCAQLMRRILVDYARGKNYQKRGGGLRLVSFEQAQHKGLERSRDLVALDEALTALASVDQRKAKVVELRFFGGFSVDETAEVLNVSADTVLRDWKFAKVWLLRELSGDRDDL